MVTEVVLNTTDKIVIGILILLIIGAIFIIRGFFKDKKK